VYTRQFENLVRQGGERNLLAAGGILSAAKECASCNRCKRRTKIATVAGAV
jgi:hypothetical protein